MNTPHDNQTNEIIDAAILAVANNDWTKTALVISRVFDAPALAQTGIPKDKMGQAIAERLYVLVDNGKLACQGNMRRWRDSTVRIINA